MTHTALLQHLTADISLLRPLSDEFNFLRFSSSTTSMSQQFMSETAFLLECLRLVCFTLLYCAWCYQESDQQNVCQCTCIVIGIWHFLMHIWNSTSSDCRSRWASAEQRAGETRVSSGFLDCRYFWTSRRTLLSLTSARQRRRQTQLSGSMSTSSRALTYDMIFLKLGHVSGRRPKTRTKTRGHWSNTVTSI